MSILEVNNVSIRYMTGDFKEIGLKEYVMRRLTHNYHVSEFWADRNISFTLEKGDMLGIIGANGAGKSTLLKVVSGIMEPSEGAVTREGNIAALLELGSGFDGDLTVRENTYLRGAMLGYTKKFMDDTYDEIIDFAELRDFQDRPFKQLSSGMKSRLAFSIASLVDPDILILDEVLSVGDGAFRKKSEDKMREIISGGATTILVSHSLNQVRELCNKVLWLHKGEQIAYGENVEEICDQYEAFLEGNQGLPERKEKEDMRSQAAVEKEPANSGTPEAADGKLKAGGGSHDRWLDIAGIALLSAALYAVMYVLLGFAKYGIDVPFGYHDVDSKLTYVNVKTILDNGWIWFNRYIGAPYGSPIVDLPLWTSSFEFLVVKILALFLGDRVMAIANVQYLLIFPMAAVTAFIVLRTLKVDRGLSLLGAFLFSAAPYITFRSIGHFCLAACYFVPLSVLLCLWAYDKSDERYLRPGKGFFRYGKNWAAIVCALLIGNNSTGYYPFFSCFFLCAVGLCCFLRERKLGALRKALISTVLVAASYLAALAPYLVYQLLNGHSVGVTRSLGEVETVGMKIAQLFIPLKDHGIPLLRKLIDRYNMNMPLVNENRGAYLGIAAIIGFVLSLVIMFASKREDDTEDGAQLSLLSRLNLAAVLFGTVGGFSSLFAVATGFVFIRSSNRISIFISFISICVLCLCFQRVKNRLRAPRGHTPLKAAALCGLVCFAGLCAWDQLPAYGAQDVMLAANQENYDIDHRFVEGIEAQLNEGDMVYQLPYRTFMESGTINKMGDYQLFVGYFHSKSLKWSYGGVRGREADRWNAGVDALPMDIKLKTVIGAGFKGVYIDTRAYTEEELAALKTSIESIIQQQPAVSENGLLLFYDLYPYIEAHPELLDYNEFTYELGRKHSFTQEDDSGHYYFTEGLSHAEKEFTWTLGDEAHMQIELAEDPTDDLILTFDISRVFNGSQRVIAVCGDAEVDRLTASSADKTVSLHIPREAVKDRELDLTLRLPDAISPKELGQSEDARDIALGLAAFVLDYPH